MTIGYIIYQIFHTRWSNIIIYSPSNYDIHLSFALVNIARLGWINCDMQQRGMENLVNITHLHHGWRKFWYSMPLHASETSNLYNILCTMVSKFWCLEWLILIIFVSIMAEENFDTQCPYMLLEWLILIIFFFTMAEEN